MTVSEESLRALDEHWALAALGFDNRDRALDVMKFRIMQAAAVNQVTFAFPTVAADDSIFSRTATAYELAATEGLTAALSPTTTDENAAQRSQCYAGAWRAFELKRFLPVPEANEKRIVHILQIAAFAYCGDRWTDLRRWLSSHEQKLEPPSVADVAWDRRVLYRLFDCWIRLLRKRSWSDLDSIREVIGGLRSDQAVYESGSFQHTSAAADRALAFRLIALYHWARATELISAYMLTGKPSGISEELDKHFESAVRAASSSYDAAFEVLLRWLHLASRRMAAGSVWWVGSRVNSRVSQFLNRVTKTQALFELLPPQRAALQEQGLLDQANRAVIVDLPTSGGKTLLAQFRILQALNQFDYDHGWVAYVAPTRALVSQITRRLRRDFESFGITVEQLTGAVEVDSFEETLLTSNGQHSFDVLVSTPEKLQFVIRNKKVARPLALIVMDEAHNIEDRERGLRIELLLATIRRECEHANFLLLMPYVPNAKDLAAWLAPDGGRSVSIGTSAWKPNDRVVGLFDVERAEGRGGCTLHFQSLVTSPKTLHLAGRHRVGSYRPLGFSWSAITTSLTKQTAAISALLSERGPSIAVASTIPDVWSMARTVASRLPTPTDLPEEIKLVQRFLSTEFSPTFELIELLSKRGRGAPRGAFR